MKKIKKLLTLLVFLLITCCVGILICAQNPALTKKLADRVQQLQNSGNQVEAEDLYADSEESQDSAELEDILEGGYGGNEILLENIPHEVSGLFGYVPVEGEEEQIPQEQADRLEDILSKGETGEELSFSAEIYPYYGMLDEDLKKIYRQVYANAEILNTSFIPVAKVSTKQVKTVMEAVLGDHPELFWLASEYSCKYLSNGMCVEITLRYNETAQDLEAAKKDFRNCAEELLEGARKLGSTLEKEKYIHDALLQVVDYNWYAGMNQSAYSALVLGETVCAGYARAYQYLLQQLQIPCYYCTGYSGQNHAWNIVKLEDRYYNVDVTWDDTDPATYNYFNKSDYSFSATHARRDLSLRLPACPEYEPTETEEEVSEEEEGKGIADQYINPNPQIPLSWQSRGDSLKPKPGLSEEEKKKENLDKAGIKAEDVLETLDAYYKDCSARMKEAGTGNQQFVNIVPESLWDKIEQAYSSGDFRDGYVDDVLKEWEVENFAIQIQTQRLGGGYCKIYHNILTY